MGDDFDAGVAARTGARVVIAMIRSTDITDMLGELMNDPKPHHYLVECEVRIWDMNAEPGCAQLVFSVSQSTTGKSTIEVDQHFDRPSSVQTLIMDALQVVQDGARHLRAQHNVVELRDGSGTIVVDKADNDASE